MKPVSVRWLPANMIGALGDSKIDTRLSITSLQAGFIDEPFNINGWLSVPLTNAGPIVTINTFPVPLAPPNPQAILTTNGSYALLLPIREARTVMTYSDSGDNSDVNFLVTGTYLGVQVFESFIGATAGNVSETTQIFDTVTSIVPDDNTDGRVSFGIGSMGEFSWIQYDHHMMYPNLSVEVFAQFSGAPAGSLTCQFVSILDDLNTIAGARVADSNPAKPPLSTGLIVQDGSGAGTYKTILDGTSAFIDTSSVSGTTSNAFRYYTLQITNQTNGAGDPGTNCNCVIQATFIQGGIR